MASSDNRKIVDAGEKIGGSRKDFAQARLTIADLADMTDVEMVTNIKRDNIWPKPDYRKLVDDGMDVQAAAAIKLIRDKIAKEPKVNPHREHAITLNWYIDVVSKVRDHLEACKTLDDVEMAESELEEIIGKRTSDWVFYRSEGRSKYDVIRRGKYSPVYISYADKKKISELIVQGFPEDIPIWKKGHTIKKLHGYNGLSIIKGRYIIGKDFESEEQAWSWLKERYESKKAKKTSDNDSGDAKKAIPHRPHLDSIIREGLPDWRNDTDVTPQTLIDVFGFRAIEFGEWLPDDERQTVINFGYDALMDLSLLTGLEPGQLSLDGTLALAFGARGTGRAAAHYEADRRVINMTRLSGAGSLAHEWGHALDDFIGDGSEYPMEITSLTGWRTRIYDCTKVLAHRGDAVASVGQRLLMSLYQRMLTKAEKMTLMETEIERDTGFVASWQKALDAELSKDTPDRTLVKKYSNGLARNERILNNHKHRLVLVSEKPETDNFGKADSLFYENAVSISGKNGYWARPNELFARAFEAYVSDKAEEMGAVSGYLVSGAKSVHYPENKFRGNPYPFGKERQILYEVFSDFVATCAPIIENKSSMEPISGKENSPTYSG